MADDEAIQKLLETEDGLDETGLPLAGSGDEVFPESFSSKTDDLQHS